MTVTSELVFQTPFPRSPLASPIVSRMLSKFPFLVSHSSFPIPRFSFLVSHSSFSLPPFHLLCFLCFFIPRLPRQYFLPSSFRPFFVLFPFLTFICVYSLFVFFPSLFFFMVSIKRHFLFFFSFQVHETWNELFREHFLKQSLGNVQECRNAFYRRDIVKNEVRPFLPIAVRLLPTVTRERTTILFDPNPMTNLITLGHVASLVKPRRIG